MPIPPLLGALLGGTFALWPTASHAAPISRAGRTFLAYPGDTIVLDGTASEGSDLEWRWVQVGGPRVAATGTNTAEPRFRADLPGRYTFELVVRQNERSAEPDTVDVVVVDPEVATRYLAAAGCNQQAAGEPFHAALIVLAPLLLLPCSRRDER